MGGAFRRPRKFFLNVRRQTTLYIKQLAWLYSDVSRSSVESPELCDYGRWIVETVQSIGFGSHESPTSYSDLYAWQNMTGLELTPFEAETIRDLCLTYLSGARQYQEPCLPPFCTPERRMRAAQAVEQSFMSA